jgi:hypothetical protein
MPSSFPHSNIKLAGWPFHELKNSHLSLYNKLLTYAHCARLGEKTSYLAAFSTSIRLKITSKRCDIATVPAPDRVNIQLNHQILRVFRADSEKFDAKIQTHSFMARLGQA